MTPIQEAENILKQGIVPPHIAADMRVKLAGEYSFNCGIIEDITTRKPAAWNLLREKTSSDKQADKLWDATEDGINEAVLRIRIKRLEKMMSAFSTIIKLAEGQSRNQY